MGQAGFWAAFIGAALVAMSNPISFGAFLGDWSRYIPRETPKGRIMLSVIAAQLATLIPFLFGLITATIVAVKAPDYNRCEQLRRWLAGSVAELVLPAGVA